MLYKKSKLALLSILVFLFLISCFQEEKKIDITIEQNNIALFIKTMQKHLDAVSNKNLDSLKSTLSPRGNMQLILSQSEITHTVDDFMKYHEEWFALDNEWTFETKILNTEIGEDFGIAVTEIIYREPDRDGKPYFNRMHVSYALQKIDDKWYIIKDHASSVEKSTDQK